MQQTMKKSSLVVLCLSGALSVAMADKPSGVTTSLGTIVNAQLAAAGATVRLVMAEVLGAPGYEGRTIYFNDRGNKQFDSQFVPGDPRRGGATDITWINDLWDGATANGLTAVQTDAAVRRAMTTWDEVACSTIPLTYLGSYDVDLGVLQWLLGFGGSPVAFADVTHAGWLPGAFFDEVVPNGSTFIIGSTFTFIWVDASGNPTDIDNNGKLDVAFRETYYNNEFPWGIDTDFPVDVQSVILHESGHELSQAHFGAAFSTGNGMLHFAPRAVMNAGYLGLLQTLTGTDIGGHCSIWARWPNR
jgi:hypothetical protein